MKTRSRFLRLSLGISLLAFSACTPTIAQRGNMLEDYQISEVQQNIHTRTDVLRILGSPTTQATFDPNIWYYIGQKTEKRGILDPEVVAERIIVVAFNEEGIVTNLQEIDRGRINVPFAKAKTPTHGNDPTLAQEFFGNLGRFNTSNAQAQ
jgi:outer membrane protein assembly factor BamE (lipoprotein component of BamABCDE complex)